MATVLVTRPEPDNRTTEAKLRARGHDVLLAPLLRFEPVPAEIGNESFHGVIITSANALRATALPDKLRALPLFAVGDHTAAAAREAGFRDARSAHGDVASLIALVAKEGTSPLLYLAGEDVSTDLGAQLAKNGTAVVTKTVYRMAAAHDLPDDAKKALANGGIAAVLHYSRQSAAAFVEAVQKSGMTAALSLPQVCLSGRIAQFLKEAGATRLAVAETPDEEALLEALKQVIST